MAKEGIRHLGYPEYFGNTLVVFKILGVLAVIIPQVPKRIKEWACAGIAFDFNPYFPISIPYFLLPIPNSLQPITL